jgi:NAD(P)-dependent dehydrogenase (short-subunit alcohol dehydrogenase family)
MSPIIKTAIITGGASGMGLAVAESLAARGGWDLHLIDMNATAGEKVASSLSATFHQCNITQYSALAAVFKKVFETSGRLDFVFANAGIAEKGNFYERHDELGIEPPPEPNLLILNICMDAVVTTTYLALHYFRLTPRDASLDQSLVITASCGGIYPSLYSPIYSAAKHGTVGLMRSIAKHFWTYDKIRVNAICPGVVKTNLLTTKEWANFPNEFFTPVDKIAETVVMLIDGKDDTKQAGTTRIDGERPDKKGVLWGEAVEISGRNHYYREPNPVSDDGMAAVMKATDIQELEH